MMERKDGGLGFLLQYQNIAWYEDGCVRILDRRIYPVEVKFVECRRHEEVAQAIYDMVTQSGGPYVAAAMGMSLAESTKSGFYNFNPTIVREAFESTMKGEAQPLDTTTYQAACQYLAFLAQKQQRDEMSKAAEQSAKNEGAILERILQENPDLKKTPEGYYYKVIKQGNGPKARLGQRIRFDFVSTNLFTDKEYVNSYTREANPDMPPMGPMKVYVTVLDGKTPEFTRVVR